MDKTRVYCYSGIRLVNNPDSVPTGPGVPTPYNLSRGKLYQENLEKGITPLGHPGHLGQKPLEYLGETELVRDAAQILKDHNGKMRQTLFWDRLEKQGYEELTVSPILRQKHRNRFAFRGLDVRLLGPKPKAEPSVLTIPDKKNIILASLYQKNPDGQWSTEKVKTLLKYKWNDLPNVLTELEKETLFYQRLDTWRLSALGKQRAEKLVDTAKQGEDEP